MVWGPPPNDPRIRHGRHRPENWHVGAEGTDQSGEVNRPRPYEKHRKHPHYLKGTIFCIQCESRYCVQIANGRGGTYEYFFCLGRNKYRNKYRNNCRQRHLHISNVEAAIERFYDTVALHANEIAELRQLVEEALTASQADLTADHQRLDKQRAKLLDERQKLLQLHYDDKVPTDLFATEVDRIQHELALLDHQTRQIEEPFERTVQDLIDLEAILRDIAELYRASDDRARRQINQGLFAKLLVGDTDVEAVEPTPLLRGIVSLPAPEGRKPKGIAEQIRAEQQRRSRRRPNAKNPDHSDGRGSNLVQLVALLGQFREHRRALGQLQQLHRSWREHPIGSRDSRPSPVLHQSQRRLSESEVTALVDTYRAGKSLRDLAADYGVHRDTVARHLERQGVSRRKPAPLTSEKVARAAELYEEGSSLAAVGAVLGHDAMTIRKYLKQAGVASRPRPGGPLEALKPRTGMLTPAIVRLTGDRLPDSRSLHCIEPP